ncbi:MAG: hypothetical protein DMG67_16235 [Acidobacteria bacterium]|nr:MAG: hypothetical protein DMG67_16235 [Acidobacteriota bacterium]
MRCGSCNRACPVQPQKHC